MIWLHGAAKRIATSRSVVVEISCVRLSFPEPDTRCPLRRHAARILASHARPDCAQAFAIACSVALFAVDAERTVHKFVWESE